MLPIHLSPASFSRYSPEARVLAQANLALFQKLPLAFLPGLLRELIEFDRKFPAERASLERQLNYLRRLSPAALQECFAGFAAIRMSAEQAALDWCGKPLAFSEQMSAYLWRTHQMEAFRACAIAYASRLAQADPVPPPPLPRLGIAVVGQGVTTPQPQLFLKLRPYGTLFTNVDPANGFAELLDIVRARAKQHPAPYAHWYIDGGASLVHSAGLTEVSYAELAPARAALLAYMQKQLTRPGLGPEELRDLIADLRPAALGLQDTLLVDHFKVKVLTEGSGTQIFSTTFAQWSTREALRRAEPLTMLVRFAPRQLQRPMSDLLAGEEPTPRLDPAGSLIDADMAAYYHWINQGRLAGAAQSSFLAWHEGQRTALAIGPSLPRNTESHSSLTLAALMKLLTA